MYLYAGTNNFAGVDVLCMLNSSNNLFGIIDIRIEYQTQIDKRIFANVRLLSSGAKLCYVGK